MIYYKVLKDGASFYGGQMRWDLPRYEAGWAPGDWQMVETVKRLRVCEHGLHISLDPGYWWKDGCEVYEAEYLGELVGVEEQEKTKKVVAGAVRLVRPVRLISIEDGKWLIERDDLRSSGWSDPRRA